jgi:hypothetical protein
MTPENAPGYDIPPNQDRRFLCPPPTSTVSVSIFVELLPFLALLTRMAYDNELWWSEADQDNARVIMGALDKELGEL